MSNKYSSDDKMQKLFESFRKNTNEAISRGSAAPMGSVEVQCDGPGILMPDGQLRLELMVGEEVYPVVAQLDEFDTEDILAAVGGRMMEAKHEDREDK